MLGAVDDQALFSVRRMKRQPVVQLAGASREQTSGSRSVG